MNQTFRGQCFTFDNYLFIFLLQDISCLQKVVILSLVQIKQGARFLLPHSKWPCSLEKNVLGTHLDEKNKK